MNGADNSADQPLTELEHACRGAIGDRLRSVAIVSTEWTGTVYRRDDLPPGADERARTTVTADRATCTDGGRTVVPFENGYVARLQYGGTEVIATSGGIKMDRETELSAAVRGVLSG
ncbi:hypothetical protein [Halolamina sp.]|jgi:hypothetical protein|uniref:DUF7522 family protein n=1 Tax=Halolamina sp. TaxID=1940283 RepID=UPI000223B760|nr:hypothetical protein Halar_1339 [halophilic archaeon DL31]